MSKWWQNLIFGCTVTLRLCWVVADDGDVEFMSKRLLSSLNWITAGICHPGISLSTLTTLPVWNTHTETHTPLTKNASLNLPSESQVKSSHRGFSSLLVGCNAISSATLEWINTMGRRCVSETTARVMYVEYLRSLCSSWILFLQMPYCYRWSEIWCFGVVISAWDPEIHHSSCWWHRLTPVRVCSTLFYVLVGHMNLCSLILRGLALYA